MTNLAELEAQLAGIENQIAEAKAAVRGDGLVKVRAVMAEYGLVAADLLPPKSKRAASSTVAVKYRSPGGDTWTGRGKHPVWLRAALAAGFTLDQFKV